jgi:lipopolysaccharide biosynthesis glycosyltransferase
VPPKPLKSAVVVVADGNYLPAACCALLSCGVAGGLKSNLFLIADRIAEGDLKAARNFLEARNVTITIIPRRELEASYSLASPTKSPQKLSTYTRLHLDEYFDDRWDRLLYLDADVRVMTRLQPLLELDLEGHPLGAVRQEKGSERTPYFNAGVLLFDWASVLADGHLEKARRFARENGHLCVWWDQDALNRTLEGQWLPIDPRWNFINAMLRQFPYSHPFIKHPTTRRKPWKTDRWPHMFSDAIWYWRTLRHSPWPNFAEPPTLADLVKAARLRVDHSIGRFGSRPTRVRYDDSARGKRGDC